MPQNALAPEPLQRRIEQRLEEGGWPVLVRAGERRFLRSRIYGEEIERVSVEEIDDDFKRELAGLKGRLSVARGALVEHREGYCESGLGEDAAAMLAEAGVLVLDPAKLARFEGA